MTSSVPSRKPDEEMNLHVKKDTATSITPAVRLEFIQNQAGLAEAEVVEEIEAYHRALFLHHHAGDLERFREHARIHEDRIIHLDARLKETYARLAGLEKLVPVDLDWRWPLINVLDSRLRPHSAARLLRVFPKERGSPKRC